MLDFVNNGDFICYKRKTFYICRKSVCVNLISYRTDDKHAASHAVCLYVCV